MEINRYDCNQAELSQDPMKLVSHCFSSIFDFFFVCSSTTGLSLIFFLTAIASESNHLLSLLQLKLRELFTFVFNVQSMLFIFSESIKVI